MMEPLASGAGVPARRRPHRRAVRTAAYGCGSAPAWDRLPPPRGVVSWCGRSVAPPVAPARPQSLPAGCVDRPCPPPPGPDRDAHPPRRPRRGTATSALAGPRPPGGRPTSPDACRGPRRTGPTSADACRRARSSSSPATPLPHAGSLAKPRPLTPDRGRPPTARGTLAVGRRPQTADAAPFAVGRRPPSPRPAAAAGPTLTTPGPRPGRGP